MNIITKVIFTMDPGLKDKAAVVFGGTTGIGTASGLPWVKPWEA